MAVLLSSLAAIGQLVYSSYQNARLVRDLTRAQLICESILAELNAGSIAQETTADTPVENIDDTVESGWLYSIDVAPLDVDGLLSVQVTVGQDPNLFVKPVQFSVTQWMLDPTMEFIQPGETSMSGTKSSGTGSSNTDESAETSGGDSQQDTSNPDYQNGG